MELTAMSLKGKPNLMLKALRYLHKKLEVFQNYTEQGKKKVCRSLALRVLSSSHHILLNTNK